VVTSRMMHTVCLEFANKVGLACGLVRGFGVRNVLGDPCCAKGAFTYARAIMKGNATPQTG
jgi:hypothetical protein